MLTYYYGFLNCWLFLDLGVYYNSLVDDLNNDLKFYSSSCFGGLLVAGLPYSLIDYVIGCY